MMFDYIICGKLDNRIDLGPFSPRAVAKVRLPEPRKARGRQPATLPISVDERVIRFDGATWEPEGFLSMIASKGVGRLLVLTTREYLHIVERAAAYGLRVDVFETSFPIFADIRYSSCLRTNLDVLTKNLRKLHQLGIHSSSLSKDLSQRYLRTAARKLRFKNGYDREFFFAYKDGYQEVFKLKEERPDRVIIALDFNSMYLDSMKGQFCDPASIEYRDFRDSPHIPHDLSNGIYRVRLQGAKQSFLLDHHPFRYKRLGRSYYFRMHCGDTIETLLHKDEISYFASYFERIEIIEGLCSSDTIEHPLLMKGVELYAQRLYHRKRGDRVRERLSKVSLQHMHSATNQKRFAKRCFGSMEEVRDFLSVRFAMNLDSIGLEGVADFVTRHKYFELTRIHQGYQLSYLDVDARNNIFSLSAQVVANARLKMIRTLECFLSHPSVELCYANVDSIHLSIHRDEVGAFFDQNHEMISDQLGALKIEAIADQGYWFDVGRYWLKKDGEVVLFKNKGFNHNAVSAPFVCRRKVSDFSETPAFSHLRTYVTKLENTFTYHKMLQHTTGQEFRFVRFKYADISELDIANLTEAREQLNSMKTKVALFRSISNHTPSVDDEG
ncbi:hypothetical protein ACLB1G_15945 [Oxalobacteraceae bacterium A2-2]